LGQGPLNLPVYARYTRRRRAPRRRTPSESLCAGAAFYARTELPSIMPNLETLRVSSETEVCILKLFFIRGPKAPVSLRCENQGSNPGR
jgi:hypothetical protein